MKQVHRNQTWDEHGNLIHEEIVEVVTPPFPISKLTLRRTLRQMGLESAFDQMLASDPAIQADWQDAPHLMSDDPILVAKVPVAANVLGIPEEQVLQLLEASKIE